MMHTVPATTQTATRMSFNSADVEVKLKWQQRLVRESLAGSCEQRGSGAGIAATALARHFSDYRLVDAMVLRS